MNMESTQEDVTAVNIQAANIRAPKIHIIHTNKHEGETDSKQHIQDFNTQLTSMDRSSRQKINKKRVVLNYILDQLG